MPRQPKNDEIARRYLPFARVVAIDNKREELREIADGLNSIGVPCVTMEYDVTEGLLAPDKWRGDQVRIVFLDLNLHDIEGDNVALLVPPIADVLNSLSPAQPYLLVFWTKHQAQVKDVMKRLVEHHQDVRFPIAFTTIDKMPFREAMHGRRHAATLKDELLKAFSSHKVFLALLAWEAEATSAAAQTVDSIHSLVRSVQPDGRSQKDEDLVDVLRALGVAAWGRNPAKENPSAAVTSGLGPILLDQIDKCAGSSEYRRAWSEAITGGWNRKLPPQVSPARLNAHCLVDSGVPAPGARGAWLEFTAGALKRPTLWVKNFGCELEILIDEFVNPKGGNANDVRSAVNLGLLECTAACDFANSKTSLQRYILAARIPHAIAEYIRWPHGPDAGRRKHEAIHAVEGIWYKGAEYLLYLDFKYVLSLPKGHVLRSKASTKPVFRVRRQVLADIAARYASHSSRPGVFSFELALPDGKPLDATKAESMAALEAATRAVAQAAQPLLDATHLPIPMAADAGTAPAPSATTTPVRKPN